MLATPEIISLSGHLGPGSNSTAKATAVSKSASSRCSVIEEQKCPKCGCPWPPVSAGYECACCVREYYTGQLAQRTEERDAAWAYIDLCPCDPDIYLDQRQAWMRHKALRDAAEGNSDG